MSKAIATAIMDRNTYSPGYGRDEVEIEVRPAGRAHPGFAAKVYAPGWRAMIFRTTEAARAKIERHPGFVRWA